nr:hypothetical protein [Tanacetum cinerariifolium]
MDVEEVSLVDGVLEGAFGALASRFDVRREEHHLVEKKWKCRIVGNRGVRESLGGWSENETLTFDGAVQIDTFNLKKSTDIVGSRKTGLIWSLGFLGNESRNDWLIDFKKTIEANIGEHSLNVIGFEVELIYDSTLVNATVFYWFIELNKNGRESGSGNDTLTFDGAVQIDTFNLKKSTDIVGSRKIGLIWSLGFLGEIIVLISLDFDLTIKVYNESRNDWLIDFEKTIEANIGEHSLNVVRFEVELIHDSTLVNATVFDWFIELNKNGRESGYFRYLGI